MSELEMTPEVETEEFTDEMSDEALDREQGGGKGSAPCMIPASCRAGN